MFLVMFFLLMMVSLILMFISLGFLIFEKVIIIEFILFKLNSSMIIYMIMLDWVSLLFVSFILFISFLVILYSKEYIKMELNLIRFFYLMMMFILSMIMFIMSPNLISLLLGWDLLGLVSYCLVVYYQNMKSFNSSMITILFNRIGDISLVMMISWMINYGSWSMMVFMEKIYEENMQIMMSLLLLSSFSKSAQIPFSYWLPMAMAAPTPVSSLVHSSTLVTAGVYLLIRFSGCFNEKMFMIMFIMGLNTMFMSSLMANFEYDLKKIIALSTLSQLGVMISIMAMKMYNLVFFHLLMHGLFKALMFLCAGKIIHLLSYQDIRYMGGVVKFLPFTSSIFMISNLSLSGLPFLSGFYSKDLMLEFMSMNYLNMISYTVYYSSSMMTVMYSFRLFFFFFLQEKFLVLVKVQENFLMVVSMMLMVLMVIMGGSVFMWIIFKTPYFTCFSKFMKMNIYILIMMGSLISYEYWNIQLNYKLKIVKIHKLVMFIMKMFYMPVLLLSFNKILFKMGLLFLKMDMEWLEYMGSQMIYSKNYLLKFLQIYYLYNYKEFFMLSLMVMVLLFI
uniref:NADH-ubiquinone oxidoreductase chain 5 n=1 Tax=Syrbatus sp. 2 RRMO-2024a TaxID=3154168 RepID=A0AAU7LKP8_9COLE